jgi:hypothetical protein
LVLNQVFDPLGGEVVRYKHVNVQDGCQGPFCGVLPAGKRAEEAIAANPEKSDGVIAEEIGVDRSTVTRATSVYLLPSSWNRFGQSELNERPTRFRGVLPCTFTHIGTKAAPDTST